MPRLNAWTGVVAVIVVMFVVVQARAFMFETLY